MKIWILGHSCPNPALHQPTWCSGANRAWTASCGGGSVQPDNLGEVRKNIFMYLFISCLAANEPPWTCTSYLAGIRPRNCRGHGRSGKREIGSQCVWLLLRSTLESPPACHTPPPVCPQPTLTATLPVLAWPGWAIGVRSVSSHLQQQFHSTKCHKAICDAAQILRCLLL